jgi:hypothetical protein
MNKWSIGVVHDPHNQVATRYCIGNNPKCQNIIDLFDIVIAYFLREFFVDAIRRLKPSLDGKMIESLRLQKSSKGSRSFFGRAGEKWFIKIRDNLMACLGMGYTETPIFQEILKLMQSQPLGDRYIDL